MNTQITDEIQEVISSSYYRPAISIFLPFEPKMNLKSELNHSLKLAADNIEKQLSEQYSKETCVLVMWKLRNLITGLNFNTHKKSLAIFVSPVFEKVLYLDVLVEEKIIVDSSFEIRDLVYSKKQIHKFLVLVLSAKESNIFIANSHDFVRILTSLPENRKTEKNLPSRVANFTDVSQRHDIEIHQFLLQVDNTLDIILNSYQLPLFVLGVEKILGHFKKLTKHNRSVFEYIPGNFERTTIAELNGILHPHRVDWDKVMQKSILNKLAESLDRKRLVTGIKDVWREASRHKGQLLVVEKNFHYAAQTGEDKEVLYPLIEPYNHFSYIKDAVDELIEKVLEAGGDVEFVEKDLLRDYNHIALITYY